MKCFNHPHKDAVGLCSQCGKATCRDCVEDIGGALLCNKCIGFQLQEVERAAEKEAEEAKAEVAHTVESARKRIRASWVIATILAVVIGPATSFGAHADPHQPADLLPLPLMLLLTTGGTFYGAWSLFWGVPAVFGWFRRFFERIGCFLVAGIPVWIFVIGIIIGIPLAISIYYSFFGGGIYQYRKYRRLAGLEA